MTFYGFWHFVLRNADSHCFQPSGSELLLCDATQSGRGQRSCAVQLGTAVQTSQIIETVREFAFLIPRTVFVLRTVCAIINVCFNIFRFSEYQRPLAWLRRLQFSQLGRQPDWHCNHLQNFKTQPDCIRY